MKDEKNIDGWARGCVKVPWRDYTTPHRIGRTNCDAMASLLRLMQFKARDEKEMDR